MKSLAKISDPKDLTTKEYVDNGINVVKEQIPKIGIPVPVSQGGTGTTSLTSGAALIGGGEGAISTRSITNNTAENYITLNTNLITANTLGYWTGAYDNSGNSRISKLGTIDKGVWNGTQIGAQYGGTGRNTLTNGYFLRGNGTGSVTLSSPSEVLAAIEAAPKSAVNIVTLSVTGWSNNRQSASISNLTASSNGIVALASTSSTSEIKEAALCGLSIYQQANGSITFSVNRAPTENFQVIVFIIG